MSKFLYGEGILLEKGVCVCGRGEIIKKVGLLFNMKDKGKLVVVCFNCGTQEEGPFLHR